GRQKNQKKTPIRWSSSADAILLDLKRRFPLAGWQELERLVKARGVDKSGKQIRERYLNHLKDGINKGPWTLEEDTLLIKCQKTMGNSWSAISKALKGRTEMR
ncbi:hypothetical protein TrRE_jg4187, partial [Triparma retinervis]